MKYWINISGASSHPFTKEELFSQYGDRLTADTPCSKVGENTWGKISDYFPDWQSSGVERPAASPSDEVPSTRYPFLVTLIVIFRLLAVLAGVVAVVVVFEGFSYPGKVGDVLVLEGIVGGCFGVVTNLAIAAVIRLLLDIEENTRKDRDKNQ